MLEALTKKAYEKKCEPCFAVQLTERHTANMFCVVCCHLGRTAKTEFQSAGKYVNSLPCSESFVHGKDWITAKTGG